MIIDAVRLPMDIERGTKGGPQFNTSVNMTDGGVTSTNQNWQYPLFGADISYGIQTKDNLDDVINFFWARRGRLRGFLFRDWSDFNLVNEPLAGAVDGVNKDYQINRNYADSVLPFVRKITRPIENGTGLDTLQVSVDGVQINLSLWSLQPLGIVRFTVAPTVGQVLTINGEFDVPVQFQQDRLITEMTLEDVGAIPALTVTEVRE